MGHRSATNLRTACCNPTLYAYYRMGDQWKLGMKKQEMACLIVERFKKLGLGGLLVTLDSIQLSFMGRNLVRVQDQVAS